MINVIKVPVLPAKFWPDSYGWVDIIKGGEEKEGEKKQNTKGRMTKAVLASSIVFFLFSIRYIIISLSNFSMIFCFFPNYNFIYLYVSTFECIQVLELELEFHLSLFIFACNSWKDFTWHHHSYPFAFREKYWVCPLMPLTRAKGDLPSQRPVKMSAMFHWGFSTTPIYSPTPPSPPPRPTSNN